MSDENWTKGPWFLATGCSWRRILQEGTDDPVIVPTNSKKDGHPDLMGGDDNLQLAAAAPDLYEALKAMGGEVLYDGKVSADTACKARMALRKAKGRLS